MTQSTFFARPGSIALAVALLGSAPAFAQEVAPPPVTTTVTPAPAPAAAPPPVVPTVREQTFAPQSPVVQATPPEAASPAPAPRARTAAARPALVRERAPQRRAPVEAAAPVAAAPVAEAPITAAPVTEAAPTVDTTVTEVTPAAPPVVETPAETATTPAEPAGPPLWPIALMGLAVLGLVGWLILSRRRRSAEEAYDDAHVAPVAAAPETARVGPTPVVTPTRATDMPYVQPEFEPVLFAAPAAAQVVEPLAEHEWSEGVEDPNAHAAVDDVSVGEADKADIAALSAAADSASGRASLDFALRPIRAGTTEDDAVVEFEVTIINTGDRRAEDVRSFATFTTEGDGTAADHSPDLPIGQALTIEPGEAKKIEATLMLPRAGVNVTTFNDRPAFQPILVVETRYHSGAGETGRISAAFAIGTSLEGELGHFYLDRRPVMWDEVEAQLHRVLERA